MVQSIGTGPGLPFGGSNNLTLRGYCISSEPEQMRLFVARREGLYRLNPFDKVIILSIENNNLTNLGRICRKNRFWRVYLWSRL
jgi:hypothetical protein